jgi:DNA-binding NtrC family response regulator
MSEAIPEAAGIRVIYVENDEDARAGVPAVVLSDVQLPGTSGTEWLDQIRAIDAELPVILVTGHGDIAMAVQALRDEMDTWHGIQALLLGRSAQMQKVRRTVMNLASTSADVVIYGETGTGKDLVARCLHDHSDRRRAHYVALNCGGLPEALAESELFGLLGDRLELAAQDQAQPSKLPEQIEQFERVMISEALKRQHGDVALAAKALGLPKQTLYDKLRRLRISTDDYRQDA